MTRIDGVPLAACVAMVDIAGLRVEWRARWAKVCGPNGGRVYFNRGLTVRHIHLSGWGAGFPGTRRPAPEEPPRPPTAGGVQAYVDMSRPAAEVLATLSLALEEMKRLPPRTPTSPVPVVAHRVADTSREGRAVVAAVPRVPPALRSPAEPDFDGLPESADEGPPLPPAHLVLL